MSKQTETATLLRKVGIETKNANFDSTCAVCGGEIRGKAPKSSVAKVILGNGFGRAKGNWIHSNCVSIDEDLCPKTHNVINFFMTDKDEKRFVQLVEKTPPKDAPKEEPKMKDTPKPTPKAKTQPLEVGTKTAEGGVLAGLVAPHLIEMVSDHVEVAIQQGLSALSMPRPLVLKPLGESGEEIPMGLTHPCFDHALALAKIRANTLAVGSAGSGKTFACQQIFKALLEMPQELGGFANKNLTMEDNLTIVSCHNEMMPSDIVGAMVPNISTGQLSHYMTNIVKTFRDGGVLVFDEFDRLMGGTAVACNMALANDSWTMPDGQVIRKSEDLYIFCTANTFGAGKGRSPYGSAEVLDGATLNRFAGGVIRWDYDRAFERSLIGDDEIVSFFHDLRSKVETAGLFGRIISPRHMITAKKQKHILGWSMETIRKVAVADWTEQDLKTCGFEDSFIEDALSTGGAV